MLENKKKPEEKPITKRIFLFFCLLLTLGGTLGLRVLRLGNPKISAVETSSQQSSRTLTLFSGRGDIVDRNGEKLVNRSGSWRLLVFPELLDPESVAFFMDDDDFVEALQSTRPVVLNKGGEVWEGTGIFPFRVPVRYGSSPIAPHLIGYQNGGVGASGLEKAYDDLLSSGAQTTVTYSVDGTGRLLPGEKVTLEAPVESENSRIVLTIDRKIQSAVETVLKEQADSGAAVVLDASNGDILASASVPDFDPEDLATALHAENAPFLNRVFSAYAVGSTWKLVVAAAALENGYPASRLYDCKSAIEVGGITYHCHWAYGHGEIDMASALRVSCNPYFIDLAENLGGEPILQMARSLGFGMPTSLGPDWNTAAGNLPTGASLSSETVLASFAFGQGKLMATPLQMASLAAAIANGGYAVTPRLVLETVSGDGVTEKAPDYPPNRVMSEKTAAALREMMIAVVESGSGEKAKPKTGSAGGKTASAQSGQFREDGSEIVHAWFIGFYPAEKPRYAIAVLAEGMDSGGDFAAPVFRAICDCLA